MRRRTCLVIAAGLVASGTASAEPATSSSSPSADPAAHRPWMVAATIGPFAMLSWDVEEEYAGPRLALDGGYRVARSLTLVGRLAWAHFRDLHDDPDPTDAGVELIERADRVSLGLALRAHAGEHAWFEAAACPEIVFHRLRNTGGSGRDSHIDHGLDISFAIGIEILPSHVLSPYVEGRAGWQLGEPDGPQASTAIGIRWR